MATERTGLGGGRSASPAGEADVPAPRRRTPAKAGPVKAQSVKAESVKAQSVKAQSVKAQSVKAEPAKASPAEADPVQASPAKAGPAKAAATRRTAAKAPVAGTATEAEPAPPRSAKAPARTAASRKAAAARSAAGRPAPEQRGPGSATAGGPTLDDDDGWAASELQEVQAELEEQATQLRGEIAAAQVASEAVQRNASGEGPGDEADAGTKTFEREHEMSLANNVRDLLVQVERALGRLTTGTYGRCETCGEQIPKPRLQAFPRATLCVRCKQREERR